MNDTYAGDYLEMKISIVKYNGRHAIQLKKVISDPEKVKRFLALAVNMPFIPTRTKFRDKFEAMQKLKELGMLP